MSSNLLLGFKTENQNLLRPLTHVLPNVFETKIYAVSLIEKTMFNMYCPILRMAGLNRTGPSSGG